MRMFTVRQKVRATCAVMRDETTQGATILLVAPNSCALVLEFEHVVAFRVNRGILAAGTVALSQNPDGSITDLWGNPWQLEDEP